MPAVLKDLFASEKGVLLIALIIGCTVLTGIGRITPDQWLDYTKWLFTAYAGAKALTTIGAAIGSGGSTTTTNTVVSAAAAPPPAPADATAKQAGFAKLDTLVLLGAGACFALAFVLGLSSCKATEGALAAGGHILVDCTTSATAAEVDAFVPTVEQALVGATAADGSVDKGKLGAFAKGFTAKVGGCAFTSAVSRALAQLTGPRDPNAPRVSPVEADPKALRAAFEDVRAKQLGGATFRLAGGATL